MSEITKSNDRTPERIPRYVWLIFAVLALFVYFFGLTIPFLGPDEARYASIGREMSRSGDWITPRLDGQPWFEKPPLTYWVTASGHSPSYQHRPIHARQKAMVSSRRRRM